MKVSMTTRQRNLSSPHSFHIRGAGCSLATSLRFASSASGSASGEGPSVSRSQALRGKSVNRAYFCGMGPKGTPEALFVLFFPSERSVSIFQCYGVPEALWLLFKYSPPFSTLLSYAYLKRFGLELASAFDMGVGPFQVEGEQREVSASFPCLRMARKAYLHVLLPVWTTCERKARLRILCPSREVSVRFLYSRICLSSGSYFRAWRD